ncbi:type II secretion system protein [bacterium]|nr:type II secretion system protein [bacterium]
MRKIREVIICQKINLKIYLPPPYETNSYKINTKVLSEGEDLGEGSARRVKINESTTLSPSPSPSERVANAFTLAEVLITLVIIGVIAAITVPTLIQQHRNEVFATALKKNYSIISQAIQRSQLDNGPVDTWDFASANNNESQKEFIKKYILPYFQTTKICGFNTGNGCFKPNTAYKNITGQNTTTFDNSSSDFKFVLNDGSLYLVSIKSNCIEDRTRCIIFNIDTNGHKSPNQIGRDVFSINVFPFTNNVMPDGTYPATGTYNSETKRWSYQSKEDVDSNCNPNGSGSGWACSGKIMREGWKMNY